MRIVPLDTPSEPMLLPDLIWTGTGGDLAVDPATGDLATGRALRTAVLICLQTDRRVERHELRDGETNRGWPGDAFDMAPGEVPLGSKLWLLRRRALTDGIEIEAEDHAREALQTLIDQGAVARVDVSASADRATNRLTLSVSLYGRDGQSAFHERYALFWDDP